MESSKIPDVQYQTLTWMNSATWENKYAFIRSLLSILSPREVKTLENACNKQRRANKRKHSETHQTPKKDEPVPIKESVPSQKVDIQVGWWNEWSFPEIVSFDCEHVHLKSVEGPSRIKAATVAVYNANRELLYDATIKHAPGSFIVNKHTLSKNGLKENSLLNGKRLAEVTMDIEKLFTGKLIIHFDGLKDFMSLGLNAGDFDNLDLSSYYRRPLLNKHGQDIGEKISLRTLCWTFFSKDIQADVHSCKVDALHTMRLFLKHYVETVPNKLNKNFVDFNQFRGISKFDP